MTNEAYIVFVTTDSVDVEAIDAEHKARMAMHRAIDAFDAIDAGDMPDAGTAARLYAKGFLAIVPMFDRYSITETGRRYYEACLSLLGL
jgi:hypothetical protein